VIGREDVDLAGQVVLVCGKGGHQRRVPFGEKTALALVRYVRVRSRHAGAELPALFLSDRGVAMSPNAVKAMFTRRGRAAGVGHMHAHRLRHTLAHEWQMHEGNETDLMAIMGWRSPQMLRRYGRSAAEARAQRSHRRLGWVIVCEWVRRLVRWRDRYSQVAARLSRDCIESCPCLLPSDLRRVAMEPR
jgi:integrase/recombinase XerC